MTDDLIKRLRDWVPAEGPPEGRTAPDAVADMHEAVDRIEALKADKAKLREVGYDALVALDSARAFILKKYGSKNPAREDAIAALFAVLQETGETFTHPDNV